MSKTHYKGFFAEQMAEAKAVAQTQKRPASRGVVPRLLLSGAAADSGTTAVHLALLAALKRAGQNVQPFHAAGSEQEAVLQAYVSGRLPHLLDDWLLDAETQRFLLRKHSADCRLATMEASGGFFDGLYDEEALRLGELAGAVPTGSAAALSLRLDFPVVLVLRPRGSRQSVLAELKGYLDWYDYARKQSHGSGGLIRGLILNEVSAEVYAELKSYIEQGSPLRVLGYLPPLPAFSLKLSTRSLGDHNAPVWPKLKRAIDILAEAGRTSLDLDGLLALADDAPPLAQQTPAGLLSLQKETQALGAVRIGVALDRCFFSYNQDNLELLAESGAKLLPFSLLEDRAFPEFMDALYLGGLYCPEILPLLSHKCALGPTLRQYIERGLPVWAEAQGSVYLSAEYFSADGARWSMSGALPYDALDRRPQREARYSIRQARLEIGSEFEPWEDAYLNQDEDLDNPRGISSWQLPYCSVQAGKSGLLLHPGESLRALGDGMLTRSKACGDFQLATPAEISFRSGLCREQIQALDVRVLLYSAPDLVLRLMQAGLRFRERERNWLRG